MKESSARVTKSALAGLLVVAVLLAGCGSGSGSTPQSTATTTAGNPKPRLRVTRIGSLPRALSKAAAVALPRGRVMVLGGYTEAGSLDTILSGPPSHLRVVGRLPQPTHDAGAAAVGGKVYLFGGGESVSMPSVVRVDPRTGAATEAPALGEPLSDLGAVAIGGHAYLVGGYTGTQFASAILRYLPRGAAHTVARLPTGTRYAGVAALGPRRLARRHRPARGDPAGAGGSRCARRTRRQALPGGRRAPARDRPQFREGNGRGASARDAVRPDGDDGREPDRDRRWRDGRRLDPRAELDPGYRRPP